MGRVAGKTALVTGGASGIGRGCALRLAEEGARVFVTDIQREMGEATVQEIRDAGGEGEYLHHHVTQEDAWQDCVATIGEAGAGLHILVNNAGQCG